MSVDKPENGMFFGLDARLKLKEATDFSGSCGSAAEKKRAPQATPLGEVLMSKYFFALSCFLATCDTDQAEET